MKKSKFLSIIMAAGLILTGCGEPEDEYLGTPDKGSVVTKEAIRTTLDEAAESVTTSDAIGVELSNAYVTAEGKFETTVGQTNIGGISFNLGSSTANFKASVDDVSFKAGAKGLVTSLDPNGIEASASFSAKVSTETSGSVSVLGTSTDISTGATAKADTSITANVYFAEQELYADYSGLAEAAASLIGSDTSSATASSASKIKSAVEIPEDSLPVMTQDMADQIKSFITGTTDQLKDIDESVEYRKHKDGSYSAQFDVTEKDGEESDEFKTIENTIKGDFSADVDVNALAFTLLFSENGVKSIGAKADVSVALDVTSLLNPDADDGEDGTSALKITLTVDVSAGFKFDFKYGDEVTIDHVSDPDSYQEEEIEFADISL